MSSKKIENTGCRVLFIYALVLLPLFVFGCASGIRDEFIPTSDSYNSVPYSVPRAAPAVRPTYQQPYQNPYGNQQPYYYGAPNSRSYYNPYEFQQPYGRNPYSDYDQYYVPPVQYYNNEDYGNQKEGQNVSIFSGKS